MGNWVSYSQCQIIDCIIMTPMELLAIFDRTINCKVDAGKLERIAMTCTHVIYGDISQMILGEEQYSNLEKR